MKKANISSALSQVIKGAIFLSFALSSILNAQDAAQVAKTSQDFIGVAKIAIPAVVFIQVKSNTPVATSFFEYESPFDNFQDDFFGKFFGMPRREKGQTQAQISQGSGFIVSNDGYILTNNHVVSEAATITVRLNDGSEYPAKVIGQDDSTDVALLKIEAKDLPFLKLGDSDDLQVGQWVVAIGNPFGLQASLTVGVVSAKGRNNLDIAKIEDFIQTDAAVNRGNSGGPLLNLSGEVIGINTAIATNLASGGYMGVGFAIPSVMAKHVMEQLLATGSVARGYLGILLQPVDNDLAQAFDLKKVEGALVAEVVKDSPADKGGLKQGDIILKINQQPIESVGSLRKFIALQKPATKVTLNVLRDKKLIDVSLETGSLKDLAAQKDQTSPVQPLGFDVETLTEELAKSLSLSGEKGVIVTKISPSSPAAFVGIKKGALIVAVNHQKVTNKDEFEKELRETPADKPFLFLIKQQGAVRYVSLRIQK